jgi:hypothetical protein
MSVTRGGPGRRKEFQWQYDPESRQLLIINENHWDYMYSLEEIQKILQGIFTMHGRDFFQLSSRDGLPGEAEKEYTGLIRLILKQLPDDYGRAIGASYLGVVLEECGYLTWNEKTRGIAWQLIETDFSLEGVEERLISKV